MRNRCVSRIPSLNRQFYDLTKISIKNERTGSPLRSSIFLPGLISVDENESLPTISISLLAEEICDFNRRGSRELTGRGVAAASRYPTTRITHDEDRKKRNARREFHPGDKSPRGKSFVSITPNTRETRSLSLSLALIRISRRSYPRFLPSRLSILLTRAEEASASRAAPKKIHLQEKSMRGRSTWPCPTQLQIRGENQFSGFGAA